MPDAAPLVRRPYHHTAEFFLAPCSPLACCYTNSIKRSPPLPKPRIRNTFLVQTRDGLDPPQSALARENCHPSTTSAATAAGTPHVAAISPERALHGATKQGDVAAASEELNVLDVLRCQPRRAQRLPTRRLHTFGDTRTGLLGFLSGQRYSAQRGQHTATWNKWLAS